MVPKVLRLCLSGWPPPGANAFEWRDSRLYFAYARVLMWPVLLERQFMVPTLEQWHRFWSLCDRTEVWTWPSSQGNLLTMDGLQYHLELSDGNRSAASRGQASGAPQHVWDTLHLLQQTLQSFIPNLPELDEECLRIAKQRRAEAEIEAEQARLAAHEHNRKCMAFWACIQATGFTCPGCSGSVFRLSKGTGLSTCVICRACGRSFVGDASDELAPEDR